MQLEIVVVMFTYFLQKLSSRVVKGSINDIKLCLYLVLNILRDLYLALFFMPRAFQKIPPIIKNLGISHLSQKGELWCGIFRENFNLHLT